jgi:uncharacterized damage-inducible protein DinB
MLPMIRELFNHQAWADAAILTAVRSHSAAREDEALRKTLHHIVVTQRAFLSLFLERPFDPKTEFRVPTTLKDIEALFREAHRDEIAYVGKLEEAGLSRVLELPWIGSRASIGEALMQVVMHSQAHRGQCATRLRAIGGNPPITDFIIWIKDRPAPVWS